MNVPMSRVTRLVAAALLAGALAAGCSSSKGSSGSSGGLTTVQVGVTSATAPPTFLVLVADKLGYFAQHHIQVKYVTVSPNVTAQTLAKGSIDVLAAPSVETAILNGSPFQIFAGAAKSYWVFEARPGITSWSDLKGKKVGLPCGQAATCHSFIQDVLASHGVDASSVTFIYGTAQGTYEAVAAGSTDAALTTAPYTYALEEKKTTTPLDLSDTSPYLSTQMTATTKYINSHKAVIEGFAAAIDQAEQALTKLPISTTILDDINAYEKANGIDPATLDQNRFLTDFANQHSWQIVPTKAIINQDLKLLQAIPDLKQAASNSSFDKLVYQLPQFKAQYG